MARKSTALILLLVAAGCASSPDAPDPGAARACVEEGRRIAAAGDHRAAIDQYSKAIRANPELAEAYCERGYSNVRLRLGRSTEGDVRTLEDRALADFGAAIRLDPAYGDAYFNRAMVLSSRAQFKPAAEDLLNAVKWKPKEPEAHLLLGRLYEEKFEDRMTAAMDHYEKYVELGGKDAGVREKVGLWKDLKKQMAAAAAPARAPTAEDEKKAEELHESFKRLFAEDKKGEALKAVEEMLSKYGQTKYVQRQALGLKAILNALQKGAPGKDAPKNP